MSRKLHIHAFIQVDATVFSRSGASILPKTGTKRLQIRVPMFKTYFQNMFFLNIMNTSSKRIHAHILVVAHSIKIVKKKASKYTADFLVGNTHSIYILCGTIVLTCYSVSFAGCCHLMA